MTLSKGATAAKRKRSISPPRGRPTRIRKPTERAAAAAAAALATSSARGRKATVRTEEEEEAVTETELDVASMQAAKGSDEEVVRGTRAQPKTPAEHTCAEY